ncbi:MAG: glutaredoxin family protein, partial [Oscillospiraceae bacterium]|nr:glutaredoxin family protein [Oscillospiraceae bacterium]
AGLEEGCYLFTTKTCPNCQMAKAFLDKAGIAYTVIDAEENAELTQRCGVAQAPTLVVADGNGTNAYANASNIIKYAQSQN